MAFGDRTLRRHASGADVVELQLRLAGSRGTVWDGDFGPGTELQVMTFQRDVMNEAKPDGIVGPATFAALEHFTDDYPVDFEKLMCQCGQCDGFGNGLHRNEYQLGKPEAERYYLYEYPGIHVALIHSYRAVRFYSQRLGYPEPLLSCGYRCHENNRQHQRTSTNHMGKAIDFDFPLKGGETKRDDRDRCDEFRGSMVEFGNFQIGWAASNRKALEPSEYAPTWIHMDVRNYERKYLDERYFVRSNK